MKLFIKEKLFSLHNKYYIKNENDEDILEIKSKIFSLGAKTKINDMSGKELVYIEQELFHLMPKYNVIIDGKKECIISKKFHIIKNEYTLSNNYKVKGNFFNHNFKVYNEKNELVGEIIREYLSIGEKYTIEIIDEKKYLLILAIIAAITNDIDNTTRSISASQTS